MYLLTKRRRLKKQAIPSQNIPQRSIKIKRINPILAEARSKRQQTRSFKRSQESQNEPSVEAEISSIDNTPKPDDSNEKTIQSQKQKNKESKTLEFREIATQADDMKFDLDNLSIKNLIHTDKQLNAFTGIPSFKLLTDIVEGVKLVEIESLFMTRISTFDRVLLTFIKLKSNLSFICISTLFKITENSCKNYFHKTIQSLKTVLQFVIYFPEKEEILKNVPKYFESYKNVRIVLDCTEIPIQQFKCLNCRLKTYSQYKGTYTVKFLIGSTSSGLISFVSKGYGGRTSDKAILVQSKLLEKCSFGQDAIMVDKGFRIEAECAYNNLKLIRPPFLKEKKQLSASEAIETANIAAARVHIERCIQRLKLFKIVKGPISQNLLPYIDDIMIIVAAVVNLTSPILSKDNFL